MKTKYFFNSRLRDDISEQGMKIKGELAENGYAPAVQALKAHARAKRKEGLTHSSPEGKCLYTASGMRVNACGRHLPDKSRRVKS